MGEVLSSWVEANDGYNTDVKIRVRKFNKLLTSSLAFSTFDTNRAIDFDINDPTEFRPEGDDDDRPIEIKED